MQPPFMQVIDGSAGEGGGQIVRSAVALSMVTQSPVAINRIRAGRSKPGLQRQHLTAVRAAAKICNAELEGDALGSSRLQFTPGPVMPGNYHFSIGTAGSTTLVLQTILPALLTITAESAVTLEGGTHNPFAPPFEFISRTYVPQLKRMGMDIEVTLQRYGFFPAGGGRIAIAVRPSGEYCPYDLLDRGPLIDRRVRAIVAHLPRHIGQRECETLAQKSGWPPSCFSVEQTEASDGPGNVVLVELQFQRVTETFVGFGKKGRRAESVAADVWKEVSTYLEAEVPVGQYLADQLVLPLAIAANRGDAGGAFRTVPPSGHCQTHLAVIGQFMDLQIESRGDEGSSLIEILPAEQAEVGDTDTPA